jgi:hypothetical protein
MNMNYEQSLIEKLVGRLGPSPYNNHLSPAQERMHKKAEATAGERLRAAEEIKEWNSKVVRRNRVFVETGLNKNQRG